MSSAGPRADHRAAFGDLIAMLPIPDVARDDLVRRMRAPERHYHSDMHLGSMWACHLALAEAAGLTAPPSQLRLACAVAFHDSIVVPGRSDNESRSADFWLEVSGQTALTLADRHAVADMIEATADHVGVAAEMSAFGDHGLELRWLLDLDLASLGEEPEIFDRNTRELRREAAYLDTASWQEGLASFFTRLLAADPLYRCRPIAMRYERPARANMRRALDHLRRECA